MKRRETSRKAKAAYGYHKHLRPGGKRMANKATRKINKLQILEPANQHAVGDKVIIESYFLPGVSTEPSTPGLVKKIGKDHNTGDPIYFVSSSLGQGWYPERCLRKV